LKKERMEQREEKNPIRNGVRNGMFFTLALVMARKLAQKISLFAIKLYCYKIAKMLHDKERTTSKTANYSPPCTCKFRRGQKRANEK